MKVTYRLKFIDSSYIQEMKAINNVVKTINSAIKNHRKELGIVKAKAEGPRGVAVSIEEAEVSVFDVMGELKHAIGGIWEYSGKVDSKGNLVIRGTFGTQDFDKIMWLDSNKEEYRGITIENVRGHWEARRGSEFMVSGDTLSEVKKDLDKVLNEEEELVKKSIGRYLIMTEKDFKRYKEGKKKSFYNHAVCLEDARQLKRELESSDSPSYVIVDENSGRRI